MIGVELDREGLRGLEIEKCEKSVIDSGVCFLDIMYLRHSIFSIQAQEEVSDRNQVLFYL